MIHPVAPSRPPAPPPGWPGDYLGVAQEKSHTPQTLFRKPPAPPLQFLGLGLGIKGLRDFPLEMSPPQEAGQ